ncbi:Protein IDA [Platanthera guangdongensis]|uniref:Protein IDA n=1 Tax=Platanthera guangdongensis TaxID=2320717 RepID=A0ABR2MRP8_9ASPA
MASPLCHSMRNVRDFSSRRQPELPRNPSLFFGFLPKAMPIPPSGPSKQHNSVGLQSNGKG